jgi:hypothetical protein
VGHEDLLRLGVDVVIHTEPRGPPYFKIISPCRCHQRPWAVQLARRGWLTQDDTGRYTLTPAGQAGHAAVEEKVHGIRSTLLTGLTEQDYRETVRVLQRMAENLERATGQAPPIAAHQKILIHRS